MNEIKRAIRLIAEVERLQSKGVIDLTGIVDDENEFNHQGLCDLSYDLHQLLQSELVREENKVIGHVADIEEQEWYWLKHLETNKIVCIQVDRFLDARATGYDTHIIISDKQRYSLDMWEIYKHKPIVKKS